ncbi:hypothetical protein [Nocardioides sp.]|jgi:hypothetical protein|uniref:hypothetical protein n=1 Tax=Nocardioides sp. TaxID=35761 RepID=UPI0031FED4E2|nr:hypothetical protein [Nocardioides sp.]
MSIDIDPPFLERTSLSLQHAALAVLDEVAMHPPDTGPSYCLTQQGLADVGDVATALAREVHDVADALDAFLAFARDVDGDVAWVFDVLLSGRLS